ncbi:PucR family transcriptional regulator ligand-binding domain-containing protein [Tessaracoccus sp. SD287]|uniref:PucR family transcriptional regulator n=1 Tax=Tessaracoccus sp. SD287 TaxID=2782008 RepID=UPI001A957D2C|nr:PucR family transcriptional regulator ligand-binding domain-containing protein [Tessaracoccus sp. SD287]
MVNHDNTTVDVRQVMPKLSPTEARGLSVSEVLELPALAGATVLAGADGLARLVSRVNVMEVPDVLPWTNPDQLLLTTGYPLRQTGDLGSFVADLHARGLAALGIKLNRYLDELPAEALRRADELDFPLIGLPDGIGFDEILNQVLSRVLNRRAGDLARNEQVVGDLVDIVISGGDLSTVCAGLVTALASAAVVTTMDGRVLASAVADGVDLDTVLGLPAFDRTGRLRVEDEPTGIIVNDQPSFQRLLVPVLVRGRHEGRLLVVHDTLLPTHVPMVEWAAAAAALVLTKQQAVAAVENKYRADFLRDALVGRAGPPERVVGHAHSLGWHLDRPVVVVVATVDQSATPLDAMEERSLQERFSRAWSQAVHEADPEAPVAGYAQEVVAVIGIAADTPTESLERTVGRFARSVRGDGGGGRRSFTTGISRPITTIGDLPRAYAEATESVVVGRRLHGNGSVTPFGSLGVFRLLSQVDPDELRNFALETLGPLASTDLPDAEDLRQTLSVLLEHNMNVAETSRALHFHYNTLRYRITKLEQILGPFTTDSHRRFSLALALHVIQMRGL